MKLLSKGSKKGWEALKYFLMTKSFYGEHQSNIKPLISLLLYPSKSTSVLGEKWDGARETRSSLSWQRTGARTRILSIRIQTAARRALAYTNTIQRPCLQSPRFTRSTLLFNSYLQTPLSVLILASDIIRSRMTNLYLYC